MLRLTALAHVVGHVKHVSAVFPATTPDWPECGAPWHLARVVVRRLLSQLPAALLAEFLAGHVEEAVCRVRHQTHLVPVPRAPEGHLVARDRVVEVLTVF